LSIVSHHILLVLLIFEDSVENIFIYL